MIIPMMLYLVMMGYINWIINEPYITLCSHNLGNNIGRHNVKKYFSFCISVPFIKIHNMHINILFFYHIINHNSVTLQVEF